MGLDSETVQNQVTSMKNLVKQTRVNLIHKLIREAKKLREKKGTKEQKEKNAKKANRWIEEVMIMKKLQPDEVSKFVLKTENCAAIVNNMKTPLETKVLAKFGAHKILSASVEKFRSDHPSWKEEIDLLLENLPIQEKQIVQVCATPKRSPNSSFVKTPGNNVFSVTPVKASDANKPMRNSRDSKNKDKKNFKEVKKVTKKNLKTGTLPNHIDVKKLEKQALKKTNDNGRSPAVKTTDIDARLQRSNEKKRKSVNCEFGGSEDDELSDGENAPAFKNKKQKTTKSIVEKEEDTNLSFENSNSPTELGKEAKLNKDLNEIEERLKKKKASAKKDAKVIEESIDPFFVTTDGEEYKSSVPILENDDRPPVDSFSSSSSTPKEFYRKGKKITPSFHGHQNKFNDRNKNSFYGERNSNNSYAERNNSYHNQNRNNSYSDRNNSYGERNNSYNKGNNSYNKGNNSYNKGNNSYNERNNSYHERNNSYNERNNSYNDRNNSYNDRNRNNSFNKGNDRRSFNRNPDERNKFGGKNSKFGSQKQDFSSNDKVHPSWEAKKKMSTLAPFQGIKTVFNE